MGCNKYSWWLFTNLEFETNLEWEWSFFEGFLKIKLWGNYKNRFLQFRNVIFPGPGPG